MPVKMVKKQSAGMTEDETRELATIEKERTFVVQAHIVKVMKTQKQYRYQQVQTDVMRNITMFKANPQMVKGQIEFLMQSDYMKRSDDDRTLLVYIP